MHAILLFSELTWELRERSSQDAVARHERFVHLIAKAMHPGGELAFKKVLGVSYIQADLANQQEISAAIGGSSFKYVINLGGYVDHSPLMNGGMKVVETHFFGLCHVLQAIDSSKIRCFLNVGSSNEYGMAKSPIGEDTDLSPNTPYAFSKVASSYPIVKMGRLSTMDGSKSIPSSHRL